MATALIDGDVYVYKAAAVAEYEHNWGDGVWTLEAHESEAVSALVSSIEGDTQKADCGNVIVALTDRTQENFRNAYWPNYKGNRKGKRKPMLIPFLREYLHEHYHVYERPTLEGDDVLGILMTHPTLVPGDKVCITIDKDLNTIPGTHLRIGDDTTYTVDEEEAHEFFLTQCLTGDATDHFPGCPSFGPVKTDKWFDKYGCTWEAVVAGYESKGLDEMDAVLQARCARILHASDYDFNAKQHIPWSPY